MRTTPRTSAWIVSALLLAGTLALLPGRAEGAKPPEVLAAWEGRTGAGDVPVLVLSGKRFKTVVAAYVRTPDGVVAGQLPLAEVRTTTLVLVLPGDLVPGEYDVVLQYGKELAEQAHRLSLSGGKALPRSVLPAAVGENLLTDLDDAESLDGGAAADYRSASTRGTGTLSTERYSAMEDLVAEGWVTGAGRLVPGLFSAWEDLGDEGRVDGSGNLRPAAYSAWDDLADEGVVDGGGILGLDRFSAIADLAAEGKTDAGGVLFPSLFSAYADLGAEGFLDGNGRTKDSLFSAYEDLVVEGVIGQTAGNVASGAHAHDARYVDSGGDSMETRLSVDASTGLSPGGGALTVVSKRKSSIYAWAGYSMGTGLRAECDSTVDGSAAILAEAKGSTEAWTAVWAWGGGPGIAAYATATTGNTFGLYGEANSTTAPGLSVFFEMGGVHGLYAETKGNGGAALMARHSGTAGDLALLHVSTTTDSGGYRIRIDGTGKGFFNGGTQTGGADFAESVKVDRAASAFEPGDVLVVDPAAERGFALCTARESRRAAGVVSTKPGILGTVHDVATADLGGIAGEVAMAIVGIVPVKVCDEGGPVRAGDLLVTSSVPGYAMRAPPEPRAGTLLGKALEPLERGRGRIEALLLVQ